MTLVHRTDTSRLMENSAEQRTNPYLSNQLDFDTGAHREERIGSFASVGKTQYPHAKKLDPCTPHPPYQFGMD